MRPSATLATAALLLATNAGCAAASPGAPAFELHGSEFDRVRGEYALVDGGVATFAGTRRHPRLDMAGGGSLALRPLSPAEFVSVDGCAHVTFETNANASISRVRIARAAECATR